MVSNISTQDYDMVAQANRKAVSGRRSKAERRGGRQGSGRSAEQLASKIRARVSAGSWTKTGSRPGPLRKKKRLSVTEVDDPGEEMFDRLKDAKRISCFDLKTGYWLAELDASTQRPCAFQSEFGAWAYRVLPMGASPSAGLEV